MNPETTEGVGVNTGETFTPEVRDTNVMTLTHDNAVLEDTRTGLFGLRQKDPAVTLEAFWSRPRLVAELNTDTTFSFQLFPAWSGIPEVSNVIRQWGLFRGDAHVSVHVTGSAQQLGKYRVYFYPTRVGGTYEVRPYEPDINVGIFPVTFCLTSQLPHLDIDISQSSSYNIKLAFPANKEYIPVTGGIDWFAYVVPVNTPLSITGDTENPLRLQLFVHYENVTLDRIIPQGLEYTPQGDEMPQGAISTALAYGARIASKLPFAWANPLQKGLELGEAVAKYLGFSRPPYEPQKANVVRFNANPALASGQPDMSFNLSIDPNVSRNTNHISPLGGADDTKFRSIAEKSSQILVTWQAGIPMDVQPCMAFSAVGSAHYQTALGFATSMFSYWSGNIKMCLEVVSSPLVRWRVGIVIVPPNVAVPALFPASGYLTHIVEVVGTTCYEFEVPYLHLEPFRPTSIGGTGNPSSSSETRVVYFSLMPPTGPSPTPVVPYVNLWISAGSNFTVGVPSLQLVQDWKVVPQGNEGDSGIGLQSEATFGEVIDDLLLLTRRASILARCVSNNVTVFNQQVVPVQPFMVTDDTPQWNTGLDIASHQWTFVTWLESAFFASTGSYVYKVTQPDRTTFKSNLWNSITEYGTIIPTGLGLNNGHNTSRGATTFSPLDYTLYEVRVPDRNPFLFRQAGNTDTSPITTIVECLVVDGSEAAESTQYANTYYVAGGDDYVLSGFLCAPPIRVRV